MVFSPVVVPVEFDGLATGFEDPLEKADESYELRSGWVFG